MKAYDEVDQKTSKQILFLLLITKYLQKKRTSVRGAKRPFTRVLLNNIWGVYFTLYSNASDGRQFVHTIGAFMTQLPVQTIWVFPRTATSLDLSRWHDGTILQRGKFTKKCPWLQLWSTCINKTWKCTNLSNVRKLKYSCRIIVTNILL